MSVPHDRPESAGPATDPAPDAPEMPTPQVREITAHSIPCGVGLLLTVLGVFLGVGLACRWRHVHWKSDMPAALPGDDREIAAYLFAH